MGDSNGQSPCIDQVREVGGGSICRSLEVACKGERYFVKLDRDAALFEAEAEGLRALADCPALRVPRVIACGRYDETAFLVLEHLVLKPVTSREDAVAAAHALAELHRIRGETHGWHRDNFIGRTPQLNTPHRTWPYFFTHRRLLPQLELAKQKGHGGKLQSDGERLSEKLAALFVDYQPQPSLLHGDLWHGNAAMDETGRFVVFDPATYFGDRETDLAMTELFGGFPERFYAAYREAWPLAPGFETRKMLYNLYHVLNHLNLFGGGYLRQAERMTAALLSEVGR